MRVIVQSMSRTRLVWQPPSGVYGGPMVMERSLSFTCWTGTKLLPLQDAPVQRAAGGGAGGRVDAGPGGAVQRDECRGQEGGVTWRGPSSAGPWQLQP